MMTGIDMVHVPYRGSYTPDLLSGEVQVAFSPIATVIGYIRAGKLRALGVNNLDTLGRTTRRPRYRRICARL